MNLVDSSGWLEYFTNDKNADLFAEAIEDTSHLIVSSFNIYEVFKKVLKDKDESQALQAVAIMQQGKIADVDLTISLLAAKLSLQFSLPMGDSIILSTAKANSALLWTQDSDFRNIPEVKYIRK